MKENVGQLRRNIDKNITAFEIQRNAASILAQRIEKAHRYL
jgi:hypothetical protein